MDTDKDVKIPDDLPEPDIMPCPGDGSFLAEWWTSFWDIFLAAHNRSNAPAHAREYVKQQRMMGGAAAMQQIRMGQFAMMPGAPAGINGLMAAKQFQQRNASLQMQQHQKMMSGAQMQRASSMDIDQREQTPIENAPSPSKRPRIDNGPGFDGPGMGPGRQGVNPQMVNMPGGPGQLMLQNGMRELTPQQMAAFAANGQKMEAMNGIHPNMGQQMDGMEFTNGQPMPSDPADNRHALQDYQMQLMLLEQQNKKRLLQARRDQDHILIQTGNQPQGPFAPNMSPSGSRGGGPSPGPNDQMKRVAAGTPKMAQQGIPGSPMTDMQNRASPTPNFDPASAQISQGMSQQYYQNLGAGALRPPSSHPSFPMQINQMTPAQLEQVRRTMSNGTIMPGGQPWPTGPHGPIAPNASQPGATGMAAVIAQQRQGNMGPPPAPATEAPATTGPPQRTQPSSPAQPPAPPTPQPATKGAAKKKEGGGTKKKAGNKKGAAAAATPANDTPDQPPTPAPAPSTPITPMPPAIMTKAGATTQQPGPAAAAAAAVMPQSQPAGQSGQQASIAQGGIPDTGGPFGAMGSDQESGFSLEFAGIDTADVLDNFDFDQFVHNDDNSGFNIGDLMSFNENPVEAGAGNV